jgi:ABC-type antimicrobial peptide transport system permease subunit
MLVAAVGIYGVQAYAVSRRTREIGIRIALGARRGEVQAMIVREGLGNALAGAAAGLAVGAAVGRVLSAVIVGVQAFDAVAFGSACAALLAAATLACWIPARRASEIEPTAALRSE